jgi:hypothetical protein
MCVVGIPVAIVTIAMVKPVPAKIIVVPSVTEIKVEVYRKVPAAIIKRIIITVIIASVIWVISIIASITITIIIERVVKCQTQSETSAK